MSSPKITIELDRGPVSLYFGMSAVQIFSEKSLEQVQKLAAQNPKIPITELKADNILSFAYIIYAGLCNEADIKEVQRPTFEQAYEVSDEILCKDISVQNSIYKVWSESRAYKSLIERLIEPQKKNEAVPGS